MATNLEQAIANAVTESFGREGADPITAAAYAATKFFKSAYDESQGDFDYALFKAKQEYEEDE